MIWKDIDIQPKQKPPEDDLGNCSACGAPREGKKTKLHRALIRTELTQEQKDDAIAPAPWNQ